jgi:phosphoenolpyruvate phosphomutase
MKTNSEIFRELLDSKPILKICGAFDAMSAKLIEAAGFDAIWAGSFAISAINAVPDASILTMTEFFEAASKMASTCKIPVIADCDTGYGGPNNVRHLVKKYESAGIAGISIEDKVFPKQNSLLENGTHQLLSEKEFVGKIIAANDAKQNKDFMIIARVEALIAGLGMNEAIQRAQAYEKAGADAILIHSKKNTPDEVFEFVDSWKGNLPIVVVPTNYNSVSIDELIQHGIKMTIYANQTLRASHASITKILDKMIKAKSMKEIENEISSMNDIFQLQEMYDLKIHDVELEEKFKKLGYKS